MLEEVSAVDVACLRVSRRGSRQGVASGGYSVYSARQSIYRKGLTEIICKNEVVQRSHDTA